MLPQYTASHLKKRTITMNFSPSSARNPQRRESEDTRLDRSGQGPLDAPHRRPGRRHPPRGEIERATHEWRACRTRLPPQPRTHSVLRATRTPLPASPTIPRDPSPPALRRSKRRPPSPAEVARRAPVTYDRPNCDVATHVPATSLTADSSSDDQQRHEGRLVLWGCRRRQRSATTPVSENVGGRLRWVRSMATGWVAVAGHRGRRRSTAGERAAGDGSRRQPRRPAAT